ncbi:MAG: hypothetical protein K0R50_851 [Eubacterium sp.]|jgi:hypothetical protein|nr:hypothetical protein [Eubacterium sp.]
MQEGINLNDYKYDYLDSEDIRKVSDNTLLNRVEKTYEFLRLSEIYLSDVKDDYGKKKIAGLRVDIVSYQLELLIRECFARGLKHGLHII